MLGAKAGYCICPMHTPPPKEQAKHPSHPSPDHWTLPYLHTIRATSWPPLGSKLGSSHDKENEFFAFILYLYEMLDVY